MEEHGDLPEVQGFQFVDMVGSPVTIGGLDEIRGIREAVNDLRIAIDGFFVQPSELHRESIPFLARQCSVFLRKMALGDRWSPRLLSVETSQKMGLEFDRVRIPTMLRRAILSSASTNMTEGLLTITKLNDETGEPEARTELPIGSQRLTFDVQWPLPGMAEWVEQPTPESPWRLAPDGLFDGGTTLGHDCDRWLAQQLVRIDNRSVSLGEVIRMVVNTEGAHAPPLDRLMIPKEGGDESREKIVESYKLHILGRITVFGIRYDHLITTLTGLHLYWVLTRSEFSEQLGGPGSIPVVGVGADDVFPNDGGWLSFDGGLVPALRPEGQTVVHTIRVPRARNSEKR